MPLMPSIFRSFFGGSSSQSQNTTPPTNTAPSSKSHHRSHSQPPPIYAPPPQAGSTASGLPRSTSSKMQRSYSYTSTAPATNPSPLRYATGTDTRTTYGYGRRGSHSSSQGHSSYGRTSGQRMRSSSQTTTSQAGSTEPPPRPSVLRRTSRSNSNTGAHPHFAPAPPSASHHTPASSRSNSSSSLFAMGGVPMSANSESSHYHSYSKHSTGRTPLRSNHTLPLGGSAGSASSLGSSYGYSTRPVAYAQAQPRTQTLHMHPLLAYTRLHRAPITYDVMFTPSARTVLDRATHSSIPSHTLAQPATDPPTPSTSRLVLRSHKFPWPVIVGSSGPRFTIGPSKSSRNANAITNLDVLYAVHTTLLTPITPEEWEALGHGSRAQQKVTKAYEKRCTRMGGGWEGGVRRIDWLGSKIKLIGVEVDKTAGKAGSGKMIFGKA